MKWLFGLAVAGVLCAEPAAFKRLDGSTISLAEAESFARAVLRENGVTGAQIGLVDKGRLVWARGFGLRRVDPPLPMETNTNIWAASITKGVFGAYVLEHGGIALDVPVAQQLSGPLDSFPVYKETATELVKDPRWARVTPRMLLTHAAGLANFAFLEPDKKMHLQFEPGTAYRYSGDGLNIVQFLVEQKKGKRLDALMQEAVFDPLGMKGTGMIYREEFAANVADRYGADGRFIAQTKRFPPRAAGSMSTNVEDLGKYVEALFAGRLLPLLTKPVVKIRSRKQFGDESEGEEAKRVGLAYGLGWGLLTKTKVGPAFFKEGHGDGAQNYMICFTRRKACMILLTNSDNGERAFRPLLEKIMGNTVTPWEWEGYGISR
jgi:CubicO group peptidase (beta-lactamase class C family)